MDYKKFNEKLKDLEEFRNSNKSVYKKVNYEINQDYDGEQGASNDITEVYDIGLDDGFFVKFSIGSDSYGNNESIVGIEFVEGKMKEVLVYE